MDRSYILVVTRWESTIVYLDEVLYLEKRLRKLAVITEAEVLEYSEDLSEVALSLGENFIPILKTCYVNMDRVKRVKERRAVFDCGLVLELTERPYIRLKNGHTLYHNRKLMELRESLLKKKK